MSQPAERRLVTEAALADALADFDTFVGVPIFETLAEAEAWEAANPGRTALTIEPQDGPFQPPAPTMDDTLNTYTIPSRDGVEYRVGGVAKPAGSHSVGNVDTSVTIQAVATGERQLQGTTSWTLNFTMSVAWVPLVSSPLTGGTEGALVVGTPVGTPTGLTWTGNTEALGAAIFKSGKVGSKATATNQLSGGNTLSTPAQTQDAYAIRAGLDYDFSEVNASHGAQVSLILRYRSTRYSSDQSLSLTMSKSTSGNPTTFTPTATGLDQTDAAWELTDTSEPPATGRLEISVTGKAGKVTIDGTEWATFILPGTIATTQTAAWGVGAPKILVSEYRLDWMPA